MRLGSLFAGVGGFDIAAERAGIEVAFQIEQDDKCTEVLEEHWPMITRYGDIKEVDADGLAKVDILAGGFPCQDYSQAGQRAGLAGDRGALWWDFARIIDAVAPRWVVGENVPGLINSRGGADFEEIIGSLTERGYGVVWGVLDAQYFGVPQRRRRVFIVGHSGGVPKPGILALAEGSLRYPAPRRETEAIAAGELARSVGNVGGGADYGANKGTLVINRLQAFGEYDEAEVTSTIQSRDHKGATDLVIGNQRHEYRSIEVAQGIDTQQDRKSSPMVVTEAVNIYPKHGQGAVLQASETDVASTVTGNRHERGTRVVTPGNVRRLTPLECERLQGFPDGWTARHTKSHRYRQMGNAVAVPVAEYILKNIVAAGV